MGHIGGKEQRAPRFRKRLAVAFGTAYPLISTGLTTNISARGLALTSSSLPPPGTRVFLELRVPAPRPLRAEGLVAWVKRGSQALGIQNALGIALLGADEGWFRIIQDASTPGEEPPRAAPATLPEQPRVIVPPAPRPAPKPVGIDQAIGAARLRRFDAALPLRFGLDGSHRFNGVIQNLSATGFAFRSSESLETGTRIFFVVDFGAGMTARGEGTIVWRRELGHGWDMGARLGGVDEAWYRLVMRMSA